MDFASLITAPFSERPTIMAALLGEGEALHTPRVEGGDSLDSEMLTHKCAAALEALQAELADQDRRFESIKSTLSLTAESLEALYDANGSEGDKAVPAAMFAALRRGEADFEDDAARAAEREKAIDELIDAARDEARAAVASSTEVLARSEAPPSLDGLELEDEPPADDDGDGGAFGAGERTGAAAKKEAATRYEVVFMGDLLIRVSLMRDKDRRTTHVIVDEVLDGCPHRGAVAPLDEITAIGGVALDVDDVDDANLTARFAQVLDMIKQAPRPLAVAFYRRATRYLQANVADARSESPLVAPRGACLPGVL